MKDLKYLITMVATAAVSASVVLFFWYMHDRKKTQSELANNPQLLKDTITLLDEAYKVTELYKHTFTWTPKLRKEFVEDCNKVANLHKALTLPNSKPTDIKLKLAVDEAVEQIASAQTTAQRAEYQEEMREVTDKLISPNVRIPNIKQDLASIK